MIYPKYTDEPEQPYSCNEFSVEKMLSIVAKIERELIISPKHRELVLSYKQYKYLREQFSSTTFDNIINEYTGNSIYGIPIKVTP